MCKETQWPLDGAKCNRDTLWTPGVSHSLGSVLSRRHGAKLFTKPDLHFSFVSRPEGEPAGHVRREVQTFQRHQVHDQGWQVPGADINATGTRGPNHHETEGGGKKGVGLGTFPVFMHFRISLEILEAPGGQERMERLFVPFLISW